MIRRDAIAISLYVYLTVLLFPQTFGILPLPAIMDSQNHVVNAITTGAVWAGCAICAISRFWRDQLDGGAIEQTGLIIALVGWLMYLYAFGKGLPVTWFGFSLCGGFTVAFAAEWWLIRRWRVQLRLLAVSHG